MNEKIACYSFLPWARKGIANEIEEPDTFSQANSDTTRASVIVNVGVERKSLNGPTDTANIEKGIELFGPGDIVGINTQSIIRVEPLEGATNFEPNYLPYIEFQEEDFAWRYTPASAAGQSKKRLSPWLALIVLTEDEFEQESFNPLSGPLPSILVSGHLTNPDLFPVPGQHWAWGHVHVNEYLDGVNGNTVGAKLNTVVDQNPNKACSRLLCPRRLRPNSRYQCFLIPTYEKGRLAGLGAESSLIDPIPSQQFSWGLTHSNHANRWPVYHQWSFRTGDQGDFESLVRRLEARIMDERVGRRLMDCQDPGYGLHYLGDEEIIPKSADPKIQNGAIYLEGALRAPQNDTQNFARYNEQEAKNFVSELKDLLNLDQDMRKGTTGANQFAKNPYFKRPDDPNVNSDITNDPLITPPIYGKWHALVEKVHTRENNKNVTNRWINHLNLDPRQRTVAGLGGNVIKKNQESYMDRAWEQFGKILEANRKLILAQYVDRLNNNLFEKKIKKIKGNHFLRFSQTLHKRIKVDEASVQKIVEDSNLSVSLLSPEFTKTARPSGKVSVFAQREMQLADTIVNEVLRDSITAAPEYQIISRNGDLSLGEFSNSIRALADAPRIRIARRDPITATNVNPAITLDAQPDVILANPAGTITAFPARFNFIEIDIKQFPVNTFTSSREVYSTFLNPDVWKQEPKNPTLKVAEVSDQIKVVIHPGKVFKDRILKRLNIPRTGKLNKPEKIIPILVAPEFKDPMYKPLVDISSELLVPNLNLIKNNTISVLESNQAFIESYMVGLNHEFSRELFWREYLTDQRGSYFKKFWDSVGNDNKEDLDDTAFEESTNDIKPIHTWGNKSRLGYNRPGSHSFSDQTGPSENQDKVVLVIRGDLLKKYPNTIVYMQEAEFEMVNNAPDVTQPRKLKDIDAQILCPIFEAKIEPDIYFLGFNITAGPARGNIDSNRGPIEPGFFFVLKERSGELNFGMDVTLENNPVREVPHFRDFARIFNNVTLDANQMRSLGLTVSTNRDTPDPTWNDLNWNELDANVSYIDLDDNNRPVPTSRNSITWNDNAADMAYILYQNPYMVAIHAKEMISQGA